MLGDQGVIRKSLPQYKFENGAPEDRPVLTKYR